jgi:hypothetical protein
LVGEEISVVDFSLTNPTYRTNPKIKIKQIL